MSDVGGVDAAASCTRVGKSQISAYGDIHTPEKLAPLDVAVDLEAIGGTPRVTAAMARILGYELMPLDGRAPHELAACLKEVSMDSGKLLADVVDLMSQAKHERSRHAVEAVLRDLGELARASLEALIALKAEEGGE
ncbi:hypothetical protein [Acidocella sp.]|uniref:hypothetical protein n=1 Tax=Acidocella sp. TaxID=50710 RepID=UPI00261BA500|nr:hypothetical protein [Acidocella sp.]